MFTGRRDVGVYSYVKTAVATAGVLAGGFYAYRTFNGLKKTQLPTTWKQVGTLKNIYFYPIKSCSDTPRNTAECTFLGLKDGWLGDRTLMVVDEKDRVITARAHPKLVLIKPSIENSVLTLRSKDMEPLHINLEEIVTLHTATEATKYNTKYRVYECGWESCEWLSRFLANSSSTYKLVLYAPEQNSGDFFDKIGIFPKKHIGVFADEVPFNLLNQASIDNLNTRLNGIEVTHKNFRGNFLLSGAQPYDEDNWKFVKIGDNIFEITRCCTRCIMTTNNPEDGTRYPNVEPLSTLKTYRQHTEPEMRRFVGSSPRMGVQMVLRSNNGGIVSINDPIYVA